MEVTMDASLDGEESSGAQSIGPQPTAVSHSHRGPFNSTPARSNESGAPAFSAAVSPSNTDPLNTTPARSNERGAPAFSAAVSPSNSSPLNSTPVRTRSTNVASACDGMMWLGYATRLNVTTLKSFQIEALNAYQNSQDVMIIQSTGSGKSLCFQVPRK